MAETVYSDGSFVQSDPPPDPPPAECQYCNKEVFYWDQEDAIEAWGAWFCNKDCATKYYLKMVTEITQDRNELNKDLDYMHEEYAERVIGR